MNRSWRLGLSLMALLVLLAGYALPAQAAGGTGSGGGSATGITADGKPVVSDVAATVVDGVLMLPVRAVTEALGAQLTWDAASGKVGVAVGAVKIELTVGKSTAKVNGHSTELVTPVVLLDDRLLAPAGFLLTVFDGRLTVTNVALKDPQAMMLLRRGAAVRPADFDSEVEMTLNLSISGLGSEALSQQTKMNALLLQRGKDQLVSVSMTAPAPPGTKGGTQTFQTAVKGGRYFTRTGSGGNGGWHEIKPFDTSGAVPNLFGDLAGAPDALDKLIKEAHAGPVYFVAGKGYQDVTSTVDVALLKQALGDAFSALTAGADGPQVTQVWENATMRSTFEVASGRELRDAADVGLTLTMTDGTDTLTMSMGMNLVSKTTPNSKPISWPPGLPQ